MSRMLSLMCAGVVGVCTLTSWGLFAFPEAWPTVRWVTLTASAGGLALLLSAMAMVVGRRGNRGLPLQEQIQAMREHWALGLLALLCLLPVAIASVAGFAGPGAPVSEMGINYFDDHGALTLATSEEWAQAHAWLYLFGAAFGAMCAYTARCWFGADERSRGV